MKANVLIQKEVIEKNFYALAQETRDSQRGVLQVLIPLNVTILLGILGLVGPLHLGETALSKTLIIVSCFCFLLSLVLCILAIAQLLLKLALAIPKTMIDLVRCHKALAEGEKEIDIPDVKIFMDSNCFIIGFIGFILGVLNTACVLILNFYTDLSIYLIGFANIAVVICVWMLVRPFLLEDKTVKELLDQTLNENKNI